MIIGLLIGIVLGFLLKSVLWGIAGFYLGTGISKSRLWLAIPEGRRFVYLPPIIKSLSVSSFIIGVIIWPIIIKNGDPIKAYFMEVEKGNERL